MDVCFLHIFNIKESVYTEPEKSRHINVQPNQPDIPHKAPSYDAKAELRCKVCNFAVFKVFREVREVCLIQPTIPIPTITFKRVLAASLSFHIENVLHVLCTPFFFFFFKEFYVGFY